MTTALHSVHTAVILAAGMGTRLGNLGTEIPKGFLKLRDKPIIEESIDNLVAIGVKRVVIVTGHLDFFYDELAVRRAGLIQTVKNARYADSGSLYSLSLALDHLAADSVSDSFLLLESDLVYERRALEEVLVDPHEDVVLLSGPTGSGDEVWVQTDTAGRLVMMSKDSSRLSAEPAGELVGITLVSGPLAEELRGQGQGLLSRSPKAEYETGGLVEVAARYPVYCRRADGLLWAEIDDEKHLERARGLKPAGL